MPRSEICHCYGSMAPAFTPKDQQERLLELGHVRLSGFGLDQRFTSIRLSGLPEVAQLIPHNAAICCQQLI
eukprot:2192813-Amphidinium_carterae.3